jgi:molybdate-binding protein/DNA-binding XRE family transcriptional regulator
MDTTPSVPNRVRQYRTARGWSQAELALRAGVSRAAVSAIEIERLIPSVAAALGLAATFGCTVEDLFGVAAGRPAEPEWAWLPEHTPCRYWDANIRGRTCRFPAEATPAGTVPHDGVFAHGAAAPGEAPEPGDTLVLACCDPAAGLLAVEYGRATGFRLLVLPRSSGEALRLLGRGLVHAAGIHFASDDEPDANGAAVRDSLGSGYHLLRVARWEEGLAVSPGAGVSSVGGAVRAGLRWVGREPGSAASRCQGELLGGRRVPRRTARDHRGVAEAVRSGWVDVGVCHRLTCEEAGLRFLRVRQEHFDLCYPVDSAGDPRIDALMRVVRSAGYRRLLGELPGYDSAPAGGLEAVC